jgi:hypothetical protein
VLISPYVESGFCAARGAAYAPLAYLPDTTVAAQHLHPSEVGIYDCIGPHRYDLGGMATGRGWLLEPAVAGPSYDAAIGRAAWATIRGIRAFCPLCPSNTESYTLTITAPIMRMMPNIGISHLIYVFLVNSARIALLKSDENKKVAMPANIAAKSNVSEKLNILSTKIAVDRAIIPRPAAIDQLSNGASRR